MDMDAWAAAVGGSIRATLSKFKWLKRCPRQRAIRLAKAIFGLEACSSKQNLLRLSQCVLVCSAKQTRRQPHARMCCTAPLRRQRRKRRRSSR
eukprot:4076749-Alexandrium_andersonii.AAC.1